MEDQLVTFETAKLAKKLGFNEVCIDTYSDKGVLQNRYNIDISNVEDEDDLKYAFETSNLQVLGDYCTAPTQSLLQRWLRERHKILVIIDKNELGFFYYIRVRSEHSEMNNKYISFEEALEDGLKAALEIVNETK